LTSKQPSLRLLIAGGGTGGHVLPAVAVVEELRQRSIPLDPLWVGGHNGVEREIAESQEIPFAAIQTGKLRRYFSVQTLTDALRVPVGTLQGGWKARTYRPDVIYSTGGAVSVPTVVGHAAMSRIRLSTRAPILTHEQTAQIGIANRTASRFADTFAVGFDQTGEQARLRHHNVVVTGNPVRHSLSTGDATRGRAWAGFSSDLPVIYITGGALGASPLNARIEPNLERLLKVAHIVHQVGPARANNDFAHLSSLRDRLPDHLARRYVIKEFIRDELPDVFAMTDVVVGRAGAGTVSELGYLGLPAVLMPLPGTWGDEQRKNARVLSSVDAAIVLEQSETDAETLGDVIEGLIRDPDRRTRMANAARSTSRPDAASRLVDELLRLAGWNNAREN
jgi:UDP-N-acetylglucosamine--N-acetylmuramyl-(pentapeptide) pyrophosphoryl-undecaprenol N-acetylglucosamine transferase